MLKTENSTVDLRMAENDVCKFQIATGHRLGGVLGTDNMLAHFLFCIIDYLLRNKRISNYMTLLVYH